MTWQLYTSICSFGHNEKKPLGGIWNINYNFLVMIITDCNFTFVYAVGNCHFSFFHIEFVRFVEYIFQMVGVKCKC